MSTSSIHKTAIISDNAVIGDNCAIGPYCIIGEHVRVGENCTLHSHVVLDGHLTLGNDCELYSFCCLGKQTQDLKFKGETTYVRIGNNNIIREYVTINSSTGAGNITQIGDNCFIQSYCHIAHECRLGNNIIMSSGAMLSGHTEVDDNAIIGGYTGVVQFIKIGKMAMIGGYSKLTHDVLPFTIADGIPAEMRVINKIGMERNGKSKGSIKIVADAFKKIVRSTNTLESASKEIKKKYPGNPEIEEIIDFISKSSCGLARPKFD